MTLPAFSIILASGAVPWSGMWIYLLFIVIAIAVVAAIIWRGLATRQPWTWWLAMAALGAIVSFVISSYAFEIRNRVVFPLVQWLGL